MTDVAKRVFTIEVIDTDQDGAPKLDKAGNFTFVEKEFAVRLPAYKVMKRLIS